MAITVRRLRDLCATIAIVAFFLCPPVPAQNPAQQSLYAQSIQSALIPTTANLEILVLNLRTHETLADTFAHPQTPIPVGSLVKPFLAAAYLKSHPTAPTIVCHGHPDHCWKPAGHGALTLTQAIAQSCNAYFLALARDIPPTDIPDLPQPPSSASPETLIGLNSSWRISPEALANAYAQLLSSNPAMAILNGMRDSARHGTANRIGPTPAVFSPKPAPPPASISPVKLTATASSLQPFPRPIRRFCSLSASEPPPVR